MSSREPPPGAVATLQLWPTVSEGLGLVLANLGPLAKLALWPLLLSMAADFALAATFWDSPLYGVLKVLVLNLIWVLFAVAWLRLILLEDQKVLRVFPQLTRGYGRFALYTLAIALFDLALQIGDRVLGAAPQDAAAPNLGYWLAFLVIAFVKLRFSFVYPAVAAGETYSLQLAWRHSAGAGLPLFGAQLIAVLIPVILLSYATHSFLAQATANAALLTWMLLHAVMWPLEAVYLAIIAVAFRRCTGWVPPPDKAIVERFE